MTTELNEQRYLAAERFVAWLEDQVLFAGRGDRLNSLDVEPSGRFWYGRLAPEEAVVNLGLGDRGERLDPCAVGFRIRPEVNLERIVCTMRVRCCAWLRRDPGDWQKTSYVDVQLNVDIPVEDYSETTIGFAEIAQALTDACGAAGLMAEVRLEQRLDTDGRREFTAFLVNTSPQRHDGFRDTNIYETLLEIDGLDSEPFLLESLPDSFRYDRRVAAYGLNCGVQATDGGFRTVDTIGVDRGRPTYWGVTSDPPDLSFETLSDTPLPSLQALLDELTLWGSQAWSSASLQHRANAERWSDLMVAEAEREAEAFRAERDRIARGIALLQDDENLRRAFRLMNTAMAHAARGRYSGWRPFQIAFLLANINSIVDPSTEAEFADIVWFATGGGKTETYLGLLVVAALHDRMTGKSGGVTAWSRFPLRMLSLQQTQRFANAMAGAELVRRSANIPGDPFSVGFFVGQGATPNRIPVEPKRGQPDPENEDMPAQYQVLLTCPFCGGDGIQMGFNRRVWRLEHRCPAADCPWPEGYLPFYVVDDEIYRFLPTVVVGTLDKAASIAVQAAMRGLIAAPLGRCSEPEHGYTYAPRSSKPNGCLVPGCRGQAEALEMKAARFGASFRLQDELHLLKDSLGAVDAHYEALLDHIQQTICGRKPKILASSATLTGYEKQIDVLYRRAGRVFPLQGPTASHGFWTTESSRLARRFVAIAPRGVTLEYAVDRTLTELQLAVRRLIDSPEQVCQEAGINVTHAEFLLETYGVHVVYGNSLRDLDASMRSLETQVPVAPLNTATLTGKTHFEEVRSTLHRLENPEPEFAERLHIIAASSMMSHGVDIDRLNAMLVLGLPLTTAEFIQTTARVGRRWPGLVFVLHKIARERDAGIYRSFDKFVSQGDRFVEAVPVTRRSRRVLEKTIAGLHLARLLALHEAGSQQALTTVARYRKYVQDNNVSAAGEAQDIVDALGIGEPLDEAMRSDVTDWFEAFYRNLLDPSGSYTFPSDLCPWGKPMRSLRDVEEQAPIRGVTR